MQPIGRPTGVPTAREVSGFGTVTGMVFQVETADALQGAAVSLVAAPGDKSHSQQERGTDSQGGFLFDSVVPGRYQIRVRKLHENPGSATIQAVAGRVDTIRLGLRANRCYGY
jgi:hypothetical protein